MLLKLEIYEKRKKYLDSTCTKSFNCEYLVVEIKEDKSEKKRKLKKSFRRSQQLIYLAKPTKKIFEKSKNATKCININIKGLFGHSDYRPNYLE